MQNRSVHIMQYHQAASVGDMETLNKFITLYKDDAKFINSVDINGNTALIRAAETNQELAFYALVDVMSLEGINATNITNINALMLVIKNDYRRLFDCLIDVAGINVNAKKDVMDCPLTIAASLNRIYYVTKLLTFLQININARDIKAQTALINSLSLTETDIFDKLISDDRIDVEVGDHTNVTPVIHAAGLNVYMLNKLIAKRANISALTASYHTALIYAIVREKKECFDALMACDEIKKTINAKCYNNKPALMRAAVMGNTHMVTKLLDHADIDLMISSEYDKVEDAKEKWLKLTEIMRKFKAAEALEASDNCNEIFLWAVRNGFILVVAELAKVPMVNVNAVEHRTKNAVQYAILKGDKEMITALFNLQLILRQYPGNIQITNGNDNRTNYYKVCIKLASIFANPEDSELLNSFDERGCLSIMWSLRYNLVSIFIALLNRSDIDINKAEKSDKWTLLMLSVSFKSTYVIKMLLPKPAIKIHLRNAKNETAIDIAEKNDFNEILPLLQKTYETSWRLDNLARAQIVYSFEDYKKAFGDERYDLDVIQGYIAQNKDDKEKINANILAEKSMFYWSFQYKNFEIFNELIPYQTAEIIETPIQIEDGEEETYLMYFACLGNQKVVKQLLDHPAYCLDENKLDELARDIREKHPDYSQDSVQQLIDNQSDLKQDLILGWTKLTEAFAGKGDINKFYCNEFFEAESETVLIWAIRHNFKKLAIRLLSTEGVDPNAGYEEYYPAIMDATLYGASEILEILFGFPDIKIDEKYRGRELEKEMWRKALNIFATGEGVNDVVYEETILNWACRLNYTPITMALLSDDRFKNININAASLNRTTPLISAAKNKNYRVIERLFDFSDEVEVNATNEEGWTALRIAISLQDDDCVRILTEHKDILIDKDESQQKYTAFTYAAHCGTPKMLSYFYVNQNINSIGYQYCAVLIGASKASKTKNVLYLLDLSGIDVNVFDQEFENTALHWAVLDNNKEIVNKLLAIPGIRAHQKNKAGLTAVKEARLRGHNELADHIEKVTSRFSWRLKNIGYNDHIPVDLQCSISHDIMDEPVVAPSSGILYDKKSLKDYFNFHGNPKKLNCPVTQLPLKPSILQHAPIPFVKNAIEIFVSQKENEYQKAIAVTDEKEYKAEIEAPLRFFSAKNILDVEPPTKIGESRRVQYYN